MGSVHSAHCFEHLTDLSMLWREIPRVCADGATFEFWMPYAYHTNAHVLGHCRIWNEESFLHMTRKHRDFWCSATGVMWNLEELIFIEDERGIDSAASVGLSVGFSVRHLNNVVHEIGCVGYVDKPGRLGSPPPPLSVSTARSRTAVRRPLLAHGVPWW